MQQRVIKFRIWDSMYWDWKNPEDYTYTELFLDDRYIVQQFTGLEDKNGVEIYEGDIVKGLYKDTEYNHWDEIKASVVYSDRFAGFSVGCENWVKQTIEVIGNVFENPELLK